MAKKPDLKEETSLEQINKVLHGPDKRAGTRREWLLSRSTEELVDIIMGFETVTSQLSLQQAKSLKFDTDPAVENFLRLPAGESAASAENTWRIVLYSSEKDQSPLGLEICADTVIGRRVTGSDVDFDLSALGALKLGVSRKHALLRPTRSSLFLIDLGSSNGTFCNAVRLGNGVAQKLNNGDTLTFGHLHFKLKFAQRPEATRPPE